MTNLLLFLILLTLMGVNIIALAVCTVRAVIRSMMYLGVIGIGLWVAYEVLAVTQGMILPVGVLGCIGLAVFCVWRAIQIDLSERPTRT